MQDGFVVYTSVALHRVINVFPLRLVSCAGRWRDLHLSAVQGRCTTPVRFATTCGVVTRGMSDLSSAQLASAVCKDSPHEGEAPDPDMAGDSEELVLFVPGPCICHDALVS
jgi:hypothetical protein